MDGGNNFRFKDVGLGSPAEEIGLAVLDLGLSSNKVLTGVILMECNSFGLVVGVEVVDIPAEETDGLGASAVLVGVLARGDRKRGRLGKG
jgi:hypothetical protein